MKYIALDVHILLAGPVPVVTTLNGIQLQLIIQSERVKLSDRTAGTVKLFWAFNV